MKIGLILIVCSALNTMCMEPLQDPKTYNTWYDCMITGYQTSMEIMQDSGEDVVNKSELYIKFMCFETQSNDI